MVSASVDEPQARAPGRREHGEQPVSGCAVAVVHDGVALDGDVAGVVVGRLAPRQGVDLGLQVSWRNPAAGGRAP